jgi:hypothetical protein
MPAAFFSTAPAPSSHVPTVGITFDGHGGWLVALPGHDERVSCPTLEDARLFASHRAARRGLCELVVHDAYHRVISREVVGVQPDAGSRER